MKVVLFMLYSFVVLYLMINLKGDEENIYHMLGRCLACMTWPLIALWTLLDMIFKKNDTSRKF